MGSVGGIEGVPMTGGNRQDTGPVRDSSAASVRTGITRRPGFSHEVAMILAVIQLLTGAASLVLGVVSITSRSWGWQYGAGFWGGTICLSAGITGAAAARKKTNSTIVSFMVLSTIAAILALVILTLASIGLASDHMLMQHLYELRLLQGGSALVVNSLIIVVACVETLVGTVAAIVGCRAVCGLWYDTDATYHQPSQRCSRVPRCSGLGLSRVTTMHGTPAYATRTPSVCSLDSVTRQPQVTLAPTQDNDNLAPVPPVSGAARIAFVPMSLQSTSEAPITSCSSAMLVHPGSCIMQTAGPSGTTAISQLMYVLPPPTTAFPQPGIQATDMRPPGTPPPSYSTLELDRLTESQEAAAHEEEEDDHHEEEELLDAAEAAAITVLCRGYYRRPDHPTRPHSQAIPRTSQSHQHHHHHQQQQQATYQPPEQRQTGRQAERTHRNHHNRSHVTGVTNATAAQRQEPATQPSEAVPRRQRSQRDDVTSGSNPPVLRRPEACALASRRRQTSHRRHTHAHSPTRTATAREALRRHNRRSHGHPSNNQSSRQRCRNSAIVAGSNDVSQRRRSHRVSLPISPATPQEIQLLDVSPSVFPRSGTLSVWDTAGHTETSANVDNLKNAEKEEIKKMTGDSVEDGSGVGCVTSARLVARRPRRLHLHRESGRRRRTAAFSLYSHGLHNTDRSEVPQRAVSLLVASPNQQIEDGVEQCAELIVDNHLELRSHQQQRAGAALRHRQNDEQLLLLRENDQEHGHHQQHGQDDTEHHETDGHMSPFSTLL